MKARSHRPSHKAKVFSYAKASKRVSQKPLSPFPSSSQIEQNSSLNDSSLQTQGKLIKTTAYSQKHPRLLRNKGSIQPHSRPKEVQRQLKAQAVVSTLCSSTQRSPSYSTRVASTHQQIPTKQVSIPQHIMTSQFTHIPKSSTPTYSKYVRGQGLMTSPQDLSCTLESPISRRQPSISEYQRRSLVDDHYVFPVSVQNSIEEQKTLSTGEFYEGEEEVEISGDIIRRRLHDGTGGSSATRGSRQYYQQPQIERGVPIEYEPVTTSISSSFHSKGPKRCDYSTGAGIRKKKKKSNKALCGSLNAFYSKRNTGNFVSTPSEQDLRLSEYSKQRTAQSLVPLGYMVPQDPKNQAHQGVLSGCSSLADMVDCPFEQISDQKFSFNSSVEDHTDFKHQWQRTRKTVADLSIPEEAQEAGSNLTTMKHSKLHHKGKKSPTKSSIQSTSHLRHNLTTSTSPRTRQNFLFDRKLPKSKSSMSKRSYVNEQLSNDIKRTQDRLNRLLHPARAPSKNSCQFFSPNSVAKGSIDSQLSQKYSNNSRVSSVEPATTPSFLIKTQSLKYSRPFVKNMTKLRSATIAMSNFNVPLKKSIQTSSSSNLYNKPSIKPFMSTRVSDLKERNKTRNDQNRISMTPPLHSHNNSESSFVAGQRRQFTQNGSSTTSLTAMSMHSRPKQSTHFFSPTYASKQKVVQKYSDQVRGAGGIKTSLQRNLSREKDEFNMMRPRAFTSTAQLHHHDQFAEEDEVFSFHPPPQNQNSLISESTGFKNPFIGMLGPSQQPIPTENIITGDSSVQLLHTDHYTPIMGVEASRSQYQYTAKKPRCPGHGSGLTISPPPPIEPLLSENFSEDQISFSPKHSYLQTDLLKIGKQIKLPSRQNQQKLALAQSLGPESPGSFSPICRLQQRHVPMTTKHSRSITAFSEEKLSKIRQIFRRFKREKQRIDMNEFSSANRSRCMSAEERYNSGALLNSSLKESGIFIDPTNKAFSSNTITQKIQLDPSNTELTPPQPTLTPVAIQRRAFFDKSDQKPLEKAQKILFLSNDKISFNSGGQNPTPSYQRSPEKATIAGMSRKKKALSVMCQGRANSFERSLVQTPIVNGMMKIPNFLSISLQEPNDRYQDSYSFKNSNSERKPGYEEEKIIDNGLAEIPVKLKPIVPRLQLSRLTQSSSSCTNSGIKVVEGLEIDVSEHDKALEGRVSSALNETNDFVQNYIEAQQKNARLLGVILKSITLRRLNRWFNIFQDQLDQPKQKIDTQTLYKVSIGVTYLLSSHLYSRFYSFNLEKKRKGLEAFKRCRFQFKAHQRRALNYSPRNNLFRLSHEQPPLRQESSPIFRAMNE